MASQKSTQVMKDFVVDTEGQCFLCMAHLSVQSSTATLFESLDPSSSSSSNTYSVQYLSRYLKMDRMKVFHDQKNIPPNLLSQVERAKLKALLCRKCGLLNQQFSVLFQQLEKTEMEIASCLHLIHGKLAATKEQNVTDGNQTLIDYMLTNDNSSVKDFIGKAEVAAVLRNETMQKCSLKLTSMMPRVKINNLTLERVEETKLEIKVKCRNSSTNYLPAGTGARPNIKIEPDDDIISNEDVEYADESHIYTDGEDSSLLTKLEVGGRKNIERLDKTLPVIPPTTLAVIGKGPSEKYKMKSSINPVNSKIRCGLCSKQFAGKWCFESHYESIHLNIKYKCNTSGCSKVFLNKYSLYKHRKTVHMGLQFCCDVCKQCFTQKNNLRIHWLTSKSCGRGKSLTPLKMHRCPICGYESNRAENLRKHLGAVHGRHLGPRDSH